MNEHSEGGGIKIVEIAIIIVIVGLLLVIGLPLLSLQRKQSQVNRRGSVVAILHRIDAAKDTYALTNKKQVGDPVTLQDLVKGGYLTAQSVPDDGTFAIGPIGSPAEFDGDGRATGKLAAPAH